MVQGRSPEDTHEVDTKEVLKQLRSPMAPEDQMDISVEQRRRAFVELLSDLEGDVVSIEDVE